MVYIGIIGQYVAGILSVIGLTLMVYTQAPWPYILLTAGAAVFAIFTKIRLIGYEKDEAIEAKRGRGRKRKT